MLRKNEDRWGKEDRWGRDDRFAWKRDDRTYQPTSPFFQISHRFDCFCPLHDHRPSSTVPRPTALSASVHLSAFVAILSGLSGLGHFRDSIRRRRNT